MSIGSNDLTQLTLGLDRDSGLEQLAGDFDERDPAVKAMISRAIAACRATGKYVGICGQGPSDHPDFAEWLADEGIVSMSLNPDTVVETWQRLAAAIAGRAAAASAVAATAIIHRLSLAAPQQATQPPGAASFTGIHKELSCVTTKSCS